MSVRPLMAGGEGQTVKKMRQHFLGLSHRKNLQKFGALHSAGRFQAACAVLIFWLLPVVGNVGKI